jgi:hypothetical protein
MFDLGWGVGGITVLLHSGKYGIIRNICHVATSHSDLIMLTVKVTGDPISYKGVFLSHCSFQNHMVEAMKCELSIPYCNNILTLFCAQINSSQDFINGPIFPQCS